ncbi:uncharacterized protein DSM5745_01117 [Aspergillus mulundensis]|uniref:Uncharacterized protein n=1 Tax=Aspergillus mulundensis TaxID=1810919 RepID=A0A3D8T5F9_9EURO|nr:hypothetical protein DSM5745_01117 [Aspergillus mulundensis]RDW93795.1 hypothetical protein DSM5745_01117 [Aspergillus mulundensis]
MSKQQCSGHVTFDLNYSDAYTEWPENLPGFICKTPPVGPESAPRFAQCCSGTVYNITEPTTPDHPAYPVTCAMLCQVDPNLDVIKGDTPYDWDDHFMCLTDGGQDVTGGDVTCDAITVEGKPMPTSYASTPSGSWATDWTTYWTSYTYDEGEDFTLTHWVAVTDIPGYWDSTTASEETTASTMRPSETTLVSASTSALALASTAILTESSSRVEESEAATSLLPSSSDTGDVVVAPTGASSGGRLRMERLVAALLAASVLGAGLGAV